MAKKTQDKHLFNDSTDYTQVQVLANHDDDETGKATVPP